MRTPFWTPLYIAFELKKLILIKVIEIKILLHTTNDLTSPVMDVKSEYYTVKHFILFITFLIQLHNKAFH